MLTNSPEIIILSRPIRSGKTSQLLAQIAADNSYDGVVCPDVNGLRKLMLVADRRIIDLETSQEVNTVNVGRFYFEKRAFDRANALLVNYSPNEFNVNGGLIIDEVGKLELNEEGFHFGLLAVLDKFQHNKSECPFNLILVVRDSLLDKVVAKYNLQSALVNPENFFFWNRSIDQNVNVFGLVLCGGRSARMGVDKAFVEYHGTPQYKYVMSQFQRVELPVVLSCRADQKNAFEEILNVVVDNPSFENAGPMTALLSAFKKYPGSSFFVVGCDYPLLSVTQMNTILSLKHFGFPAVCFVREHLPTLCEPLLTLYHHSCYADLLNYYNAGHRSLSKFLTHINAVKMEVADDAFLKSFDTPNDFNGFVK